MLKKKNLKIVFLVCFVACLLPFCCFGQGEAEEFNEQDGIGIISENLWVFPINQLGNSLYYNKDRVITRADLTIIDALEAYEGFVYLGMDINESPQLGYAGENGATFTAEPGEFYYLVTKDKTKKRYFWVTDENKLESLLKYNTVAGLAFNEEDKAAFYHIAKGETIVAEDGTDKYQFTFRIHIADRTNYTVYGVASVTSFYYYLKLEWINSDELKYTLRSGETEILTVP